MFSPVMVKIRKGDSTKVLAVLSYVMQSPVNVLKNIKIPMDSLSMLANFDYLKNLAVESCSEMAVEGVSILE